MGMVRSVGHQRQARLNQNAIADSLGACDAMRGGRRAFFAAWALLMSVVLAKCGGATAPTISNGTTLQYKFSDGPQGWTPGIADYAPVMQDAMMFVADYRALPAPFTSSALFMSSTNRSDDAFMFYKGEVLGLVQNANYEATFNITIVTDVPHGCSGVGGAPGEDVFFKAGAASIEPMAILAADGDYRMNIDKGNQGQGGANAAVIGDIANDLSCDPGNQNIWRSKTLNGSASPVSVRSTADGSLWLMFGTDSGFEGVTSLYITEVDVSLQKHS